METEDVLSAIYGSFEDNGVHHLFLDPLLSSMAAAENNSQSAPLTKVFGRNQEDELNMFLSITITIQ